MESLGASRPHLPRRPARAWARSPGTISPRGFADAIRPGTSRYKRPDRARDAVEQRARFAKQRRLALRVAERLHVERARHLDLLDLVAAVVAGDIPMQLHDRLDDLPGFGAPVLADECQRYDRRHAGLDPPIGLGIDDPLLLRSEGRPRALL